MKRTSIALVALLCSSLMAFGQLKTGKDIAVTDTETGKVRGYISNDIFTYKGIPYGQAKRFETAAKPANWEGVRSSMTYGPVAPLITPTTSVNDEIEFVFDHDWGYTSEDCLVLNVWTPGINDGKKRPVMFWIHGGGFAAGSSQELPSYHGENLAKKGDVVVVSINHRLNVLGFLDLSAYGDKYRNSANNSILDMKLALEWVKSNIANFGGDPENVTIFGQSGGGAKVNTLMAMPSAKGLFHKAVNQSGAFRSEMLEKEATQAIAAEVLTQLDINARNVDEIQTVPFEKLAAAGQKALQVVSDRMKAEGKEMPAFGLSWGPSRDGEVLPHQLLSEAALAISRDVPLLIGTVKNEFMPSLGGGLTHASEKEILQVIEKQQGDQAKAFVAAAKKAYPDYRLPSDLIDIDTRFRPGCVYQANVKSALPGGAPVYMYMFTWQSPVMDGKYKALHCMELPFVFDNVERSRQMTGATAEAQALADKMSRSWINFARFGNPNIQGLPKWEAYTGENGTTMFFDDTCKIRHHHDQELLTLLGLLP
ncbi:carboxylesterase/lipase family protein [Flavilitoribacter nigricans]|uniref:Carboxylic ester hydrolase n=1 Tax=Flavilitoribacter nigricans (strain ATCC 23147 / DSM 23189 / NBRC 102662 / NCIMB 1420 / SS-2) TaxID=1122177 RepID=A0A2D0NB14_FLAN2|nr:carboxylesterase family protein [Flavilitoribacter nigricans]PHN05550.1 carboxylesterase [Flavilitoribacter nigricans DSM 23189 = NBRC 102662]